MKDLQKRAFNTAAPGAYGDDRLGEYLASIEARLEIAENRTRIQQALIAGAAAGDHTVTGIEVGDEIVSVINFDSDGTTVSDLTSEFAIEEDGKINNEDGTTTDGKLLVTYLDLT